MPHELNGDWRAPAHAACQTLHQSQLLAIVREMCTSTIAEKQTDLRGVHLPLRCDLRLHHHGRQTVLVCPRHISGGGLTPGCEDAAT